MCALSELAMASVQSEAADESVGAAADGFGDVEMKGGDTLQEMDDRDSDSGNLVIAEPDKKPATVPAPPVEEKSPAEKSPRKRRSKVVEDSTPTRTPSSRVKGRGLAYLLAMEKGGSRKKLAEAQAQAEAQDAAVVFAKNEEPQEAPAPIEVEPPQPPVKEKEILPKSPVMEKTQSPVPTLPIIPTKAKSRKSYGGANIQSPLLKEPFKNGQYLGKFLFFHIFKFHKTFIDHPSYFVCV